MNPPELHGGLNTVKAHEWITSMERIFQIVHCSEENKVVFASHMMKSPAVRWWVRLRKNLSFSSLVSHYAKNRREKKETTEPPPCVIYPKRGKGNARSKPRKEHGLATKEDGFGSRLCEGKVLGTLRIRSTLRDPRTEGRKIGC
ncbi:hypothetical protein KIW84_040314 [Lathyrus oleraceus]|uniref:Retrotransposon gag domain-containing protein n=1 Tax=Pisum sativum TaxID=3888 RepID=A0A9D5APK8_PEA|nr:hypothetical protein KIW84_040314 [Pisum sativum]